MNRDSTDPRLSHYERCLVGLYEQDPSVTYDLNQDELQTLLGLVGEEDSVIDAILKNSGASKRERAEQLGLQESDFDYEDVEDDGNAPILEVDNIEVPNVWSSLWGKIPNG